MIGFTREINTYIAEIDKLYRSGQATEHSYRPALKSLFESITAGLTITNEPKHIECGAPDYIITKDSIPLGYIEAKDIKAGLDNKQNKEQFDRYKHALGNLIITDYLTFQLFVDGEPVVSVAIAGENNGMIIPEKKQFETFLEMINQFTGYSGKSIYTSEQLAKKMADKAKLLAAIIKSALNGTKADNGTLSEQYIGFKKILIHNLAVAEFADIYAQTLAYGLFASRLNQSDNQLFSRYHAAQFIPQSNPFLRKFFYYIAGVDLDVRITWIVDALADLFNYVAVEEIKKEFGKAAQDPYIHFYETFLAEYDPALRETRGVYYTPMPVVQFIVRAVDDILKSEFNLNKGLADYSTTKRTVPGKDGKPETMELHKVQILDPATGTGTFLAEVIDTIFSNFANNKGAWPDYCDKHLIPRLNGFEILMAPYAMAHFKLDMKLKETGYTFKDSSRLRVFLTNSLEEPEDVVSRLPMVEWLTQEGSEANSIKRDAPVMVVLGNPPYSVSSQNHGQWIQKLISDYKTGLNEKKINLDDDYIKFIRYGQYYIEKNGSGILSYISNNSFIDGITHRQMRKTLLDTFNKIYILNLHGNSRKKEFIPGDGRDENVFDIQQGVSINIFIKTQSQNEGKPGEIFYYDLFNKREQKQKFLLENTLKSIQWESLRPKGQYYFFTPKDFSNKALYEKGFSISEIFTVFNSGIKTDRDLLFIDVEKDILSKRMRILFSGNFDHNFSNTFSVKDSGSYTLTKVIKNKTFDENCIKVIMYRPFDYQYIYYKTGITSRPAFDVMQHIVNRENLVLLTSRTIPPNQHFDRALITNILCDIHSASDQTYAFPLYLYPVGDALDKTALRRPNLNQTVVADIAKSLGLHFTDEKENSENTFAPIDILDYIYAVLYSNNYREKYKEFLKIDFPRIPYPQNAEHFYKLSAIGSILRNLHLMVNINPSSDIADFPVMGTNVIDTLHYKDCKVFINKTQYFSNVPAQAWEYYIGGYQPAQKWLKDRKGHVLSFADLEHYKKIIFVLLTTIKIQSQLDEVVL